MAITPTLDLERELFAQGVKFVGGVDEVGRGAIAGPVTVGVAVIDAQVPEFPKGLRDSKLMSKPAREKIIQSTQDWVVAHALGSASAQEIDDIGIVNALRLAWMRAYGELEVVPDHVILDGKHNWIAPTDVNLLTPNFIDIPVTMKIKADAHCAVVAAASVLAKVSRDQEMVRLHEVHPQFGWNSNVGYGAEVHMQAIAELGATEYHRRSWNLPTRL